MCFINVWIFVSPPETKIHTLTKRVYIIYAMPIFDSLTRNNLLYNWIENRFLSLS